MTAHTIHFHLILSPVSPGPHTALIHSGQTAT